MTWIIATLSQAPAGERWLTLISILRADLVDGPYTARDVYDVMGLEDYPGRDEGIAQLRTYLTKHLPRVVWVDPVIGWVTPELPTQTCDLCHGTGNMMGDHEAEERVACLACDGGVVPANASDYIYVADTWATYPGGELLQRMDAGA